MLPDSAKQATRTPWQPLPVYLVGGAVRDALLGLPVVRDTLGRHRRHTRIPWTERFINRLANSFPVFLTPRTKKNTPLLAKKKASGRLHWFYFVTFAPRHSAMKRFRTSRPDQSMQIAQDQSNLIDPSAMDSRTYTTEYFVHVSMHL